MGRTILWSGAEGNRLRYAQKAVRLIKELKARGDDDG